MKRRVSQPVIVQRFRFLDELAANAWPAPVQQELEDWRIRSSNGVTRRASSVLTAGPIPSQPDWLSHIEDFYKRRGLPSRFQISSGSPAGLDTFLEAHGYSIEVPSIVQVATVAEVAEKTRPPQPAFSIVETDALTDEWLDAFIEVEGFPAAKTATYKAIYNAIGPRACYVHICAGDETVGVGMAVTERGWSGIFSVAARPAFRRQGIATGILHRLTSWSLACNAHNLYLQVVQSNESAISLYRRMGFSDLYTYHYRTKGQAYHMGNVPQ